MCAKFQSFFWQEDPTPYRFFVNSNEITDQLEYALGDNINSEDVIEIVYQREAIFKVRAVTRCTSTIEGHAEAVISVQFSPDGRYEVFGREILISVRLFPGLRHICFVEIMQILGQWFW